MVNIQKFLLSLLPAIGDRPAPVFLPPVFAAAVASDSSIEGLLHAIEVAEHDRKLHDKVDPVPRAYPEIGGEHITEEWLRSLTDRDCLWRFR
jgi:hypothetical protein